MYLTKEEYDFIYDRVPRLCVDLVIKNEKGILLTWRKIDPQKNTWHLPGGRVRFSESLDKAAKRIAKQETGITIAIDDFLGVMEFTREVQDGKIRHSVSIALLVHPITGKLKESWQSSEAQFFLSAPEAIHKIHWNFLKSKNLLQDPQKLKTNDS